MLKHSLLSTELWSHCELNDATQHRALPQHQGEEINIKYFISSSGNWNYNYVYSHTLVPLRHNWPQPATSIFFYFIKEKRYKNTIFIDNIATNCFIKVVNTKKNNPLSRAAPKSIPYPLRVRDQKAFVFRTRRPFISPGQSLGVGNLKCT